MYERLEAIVVGRVQGVMYRDFVRRTARGLALRGEVKNLPDGSVRVVAEGPRRELETLLARLSKGSLFSNVKGVTHVFGVPLGQYRSFEIV